MGETKTDEMRSKDMVQEHIEGLKVRDYMDILSELTGLVRDNNITNFQLTLSLHEENGTDFNRPGQRSESDGLLNQLNTGGKNE